MATIQGIYLALFGRPADPAGLAYYNQAANNGADLTAVGALTSSPEYLDQFEGMNDQQKIESIYLKLFNRLPELAGLTFYLNMLSTGQATIQDIAIIILDGAQGADAETIANKVEAADAFTAALDTPEEISAYQGEDAAAAGRAFLAPVTNDDTTIPPQAAVDAAILQIVGESQSNAFTLTQGTDTFLGGDGDDVFNAPVEQTGLLPIQTLGDGDMLQGGDGWDVLNAGLTNAYTVPAALGGIEEVNISAPGALLGLGLFSPTLDVANADSIEVLGFRGLANGAEVDNLQTALSELNISDVSQGPLGPGEFEVNHVGSALDGAADELAINLNNVSDNDVLNNPGTGPIGIDLDTDSMADDAGYETLNIDSSGLPSFVEVYGDALFVTHTVNITGDAELDINHGHAGGAAGGPVTWNADPLELINAETFTGDLLTEVSGTGDIEVRGGSGDDSLEFWGMDGAALVSGNDGDDYMGFGAMVDATATGGLGDDVFDFAQNGAVGFDANDSVDGNEGDNELWIELYNEDGTNEATLLVDGVGANIVNIASITHYANSAIADDINIDWSRSGSATVLKLEGEEDFVGGMFIGDYNGNDVTVTNLTNDDTVIVEGTDIEDLELSHANGAGLSDQINLVFDTDAMDAGGSLVVNDDLDVASDVEQLNLELRGEGDVTITDADSVDSDILITGSADLSIGAGDEYDFDSGVIDASAATGDLEIFVDDGSQNVLTGQGTDMVWVNSSVFGDGDLIDLSAGGADTVEFDTFYLNSSGDLDDNDYHHVAGFDVTDDVINIDLDNFFGTERTNNTAVTQNEALNIREVLVGDNIDLSATPVNFLKFTTAVDTSVAASDSAQQAFDTALGGGSVDMANGTDYVTASLYDSTNEQMLLFQVDAGTLLTAGDDVDVIATVGMSYADYLAFNDANFNFA